MNDRRPVFDQINLVVDDMDATIEFYRRLGIEIDDPPDGWADHHRTATTPGGIDFDIDSSTFAARWNAGSAPGRTGPVLGFRVATRDDVDAIYADLTSEGYRGEQPPYDAFWGARYAVVADPGGNPVGIMSPADAQHRTPPPEPPT